MTGQRSRDLVRLAGTVLQPGFAGTTPPPWVLRWLGEGLGGVALFGRNIEHPAQVAALTAALRAERPDVIVAIDEEAGDVTRLETLRGSSRPGNLALGAVDDVALTEAVARDLGHDLATAGVTLNYAPDADVNTDARNPVIGVRSFGADPDLVARHTAAWITGLQSAGVAACAKHFPGHGNTSVDSHIDVPKINASRAELDAVELPPFRAAIAAGTQAIMTGHLVVPAIDPEWPATLSRRVLVDLLRDELGFAGAVVTDGIEMAAIARRYGFEAAAVRALAAGSDAVCVGGDHFDEDDARRLRDAVVEAVATGELPEERLAEAAKRVEQLAEWTVQTRAASGPAAPGLPAHLPDHGPTKSVRGAREGAAFQAPGPARAERAPISTGGAPDRPDGTPVGLLAARRAVRLTVADGATPPPLTAAPHVVEFAPPANMAAGTQTPWGVATPLRARMPGTTAVRLTAADPEAALRPARGRPLVVIVRDVHRYRWMAQAVAELLAERPDAVVVEMGVPELVTGAVHLATYGATRACGEAAAEVLAGSA